MIKLVASESLACEPIVRRVPRTGELCVVCGYGGQREPDSYNYVGASFSSDNGKSWSKPIAIAKSETEAACLSDFYVYGDELRVFAHFHNGYFHDWHSKMLVSADGRDWREKAVPAGLERFCVMRGAIVLPGGRVIVPYQKYPDEYDLDKNVPIFRSRTGFVTQGAAISDDGENFRLVKIRDYSLSERWLWTEATIGRRGGELVMLTRMDGSGRLYVSRSSDCGETWSEPILSDIKNPGNKPKLINIDDNRLALLNTPVAGTEMRDRYPLCVCYSDDGMRTHTREKKIFPVGGVQSYPDGFYENGRIKFTFDFNRKEVFFVDIKAVTK